MEKQAFIVLGAGYGDEGKGVVTDYFSHHFFNDNPVVIRFSGGHQAGHTVQVGTKEHVFSSFGSGTLRGVPTFWSQYCTFYPLAAHREYLDLVDKDLLPKLFVDPLCPVTTPYDVWFNQYLEDNRTHRHGSVGVGFGTTIERHTLTHYRLYAGDLAYPTIVAQKLEAIKAYYKTLVPGVELDALKQTVQEWIFAAYQNFFEIRTANQVFNEFDTYIFEGSQGILLDMDFGFFPHVTRSNTTSKNAIALLRDHVLCPVDVNVAYVTRAYHTRHGNGPLSGEATAADMGLVNLEGETNVSHAYQGEFRYAPLDMEFLDYAINTDRRNFSEKAQHTLFVTCLDQEPTIFNEGYIDYLIQYLGFPAHLVFTNTSPCSDTIRQYEEVPQSDLF